MLSDRMRETYKRGRKMGALAIIAILIFIVFSLVTLAVIQIQMSGMKVRDFWSFVKANQILDKLDKFARKYQKLSSSEQLIFLNEAEKVFEAFEKVPSMLWEEEYQKYMDVLDKYRSIKLLRWEQN